MEDKKVPVIIDYADGRWNVWRPNEDSPEESEYCILVSESTVEMWEAVAHLDYAMQGQLKSLDNIRYSEQEGGNSSNKDRP